MTRVPTAKNLFVTAAAVMLLPAAASAQEACSAYTVKQGDSLGTIAETAYGTYDYQNIFNANRNVIGSNPNSLEEGTVLQLPCEDGNIAGAGSAEDIIAEQEQIASSRQTQNDVYAPAIRIVTGNNWAPFADESLNGGGFVVRLATTSLHRGGNDRDYNVSFVDDWSSHLDTLLPLGAFDVSLAWYIPDCTKLDLLSEASQRRCTEFDASVPVYEPVVGYFTLPDSDYAGARTLADYEGARFCRMDGYFTNDLEEAGLDGKVELVRPVTPADCVEAVLNGTADVTGMEIQSAVDAMSSMGLQGNELLENTNITSVNTLRFITHKTNPYGRQYIAMLNRGLNEMRESGEWYAVVSSTLAEHNQMMNSQ